MVYVLIWNLGHILLLWETLTTLINDIWVKDKLFIEKKSNIYTYIHTCAYIFTGVCF